MAHLHDDDEQRNDRFDVDADYEGGEWIGGEFYHRGKKQKRQQTKEDQIYGVFAEDSGAGGQAPAARGVGVGLQTAGNALLACAAGVSSARCRRTCAASR